MRAIGEVTDARVTLLGGGRGRARSTRSRTRAPTRTRPSTAGWRARRSTRSTRAPRSVRSPARSSPRWRSRSSPAARSASRSRSRFYSRDLNDVAEAVDLVRNRVLVATGVALALAMVGAFLVAQALARRVGRLELAADEVAHGRFIDPLPVDSEGRARPADAHVQPDAGAAAAGGRGAQGVHRHRLARAAHADLLAGRLRRAAPGRGPRRGDPARVPRDDGRAGGAPAEAVRGPARPVPPRRRLGRAARRARRPRPSWPAASSTSSRRRWPTTTPTSRSSCRITGPRRSATLSGWLRSCASCSTTRCGTRPRART